MGPCHTKNTKKQSKLDPKSLDLFPKSKEKYSSSTSEKHPHHHPESTHEENLILDDFQLHLTPNSQNCLKNIQNKKFITHIKSPPESVIIEEINNILEDPGKLIKKRPKFQLQVETNKIDMTITLKSVKNII